LSGGVRLAIDRDALRMALKRPALGWGLGTFKTVYPQFRSFYSNFFVNAAHNDYLQLLAETGVLGFAIMIWFLLALWRRSNKKLANWSANVNGAVTLGALIGCLGILIHSFVDFNLQIPANAALFYVLCVVAASEPLVESTRRKRSTTAEVSMSAPAV
jgi:O-antigen ligase